MPWSRLHDDEEQRRERHDASGKAEQRGSAVQVARVPSRLVNRLGIGRDGTGREIGDDLMGSDLAPCETDSPSFAALSRSRRGV